MISQLIASTARPHLPLLGGQFLSLHGARSNKKFTDGRKVYQAGRAGGKWMFNNIQAIQSFPAANHKL